MNIQKVHAKDGTIEVTFSRPNGHEHEATVFASKDEPLPEFSKALQALRKDLASICEIEGISGLEIVAVTVGRKKDIRNFVLSGKRVVEAGTYAISAPLLHEYEGEAAAASNAAPTTTVKKIDKLLEEAKRFVQGQRVQKDLFDEGEDEAAEG